MRSDRGLYRVKGIRLGRWVSRSLSSNPCPEDNLQPACTLRVLSLLFFYTSGQYRAPYHPTPAPRITCSLLVRCTYSFFAVFCCPISCPSLYFVLADVTYAYLNTALTADITIGLQRYCARVITTTSPKVGCNDLTPAEVHAGTGGLYANCAAAQSLCAASSIAQQQCPITCQSCDKLSNQTLVELNQDVRHLTPAIVCHQTYR